MLCALCACSSHFVALNIYKNSNERWSNIQLVESVSLNRVSNKFSQRGCVRARDTRQFVARCLFVERVQNKHSTDGHHAFKTLFAYFWHAFSVSECWVRRAHAAGNKEEISVLSVSFFLSFSLFLVWVATIFNRNSIWRIWRKHLRQEIPKSTIILPLKQETFFKCKKKNVCIYIPFWSKGFSRKRMDLLPESPDE